MLLMSDAVQQRESRDGTTLIVILYDAYLYFQPQISDNGYSSASLREGGMFLFRDRAFGRRRLLALSSDVHTIANWTTKSVGVGVTVNDDGAATIRGEICSSLEYFVCYVTNRKYSEN